MTIGEQQIFLKKEYAEVVRYMNNAKDALQKSRKNGSHYADKKYVRTACAVAYSGVLLALDAWFETKDVQTLSKRQRKSIDYYKRNVSKLDKKMSDRFDTVYNVLHLSGYYDGETSIKVIDGGFESAYEIIEKIKPEDAEAAQETK